MGKRDKLIRKILAGNSDAAIKFDDIVMLLKGLGFTEHVRGSHHIFRHSALRGKINLQRDGSHVKPYQVRQVRFIISKYRLGE